VKAPARHTQFVAIICVSIVTISTIGSVTRGSETSLSDLDLSGITQGWGQPQADAAVTGAPLRVGGKLWENGIGTHAHSTWTLLLDGKATEFRASVGVQEYPGQPGLGSVEFVVRGDGKDLFRSGVMRGGDEAKPVCVDLHGVKELVLEVTDAGDGNRSDHADWLEPVIVHDGAPLPKARPIPPEEALIPDQPGEPPNAGATVDWNEQSGALRLTYDGRILFDGHAAGAKLSSATTREKQAVTQTITLSGSGVKFEGDVSAGSDLIAAETRGTAQDKFPCVRTTIGGPSRNLRNNGVYDRQRDWLLTGPDGHTRVEPVSATQFKLVCTGDVIKLEFDPRFYQRHKNISYFRPWTYRVRQDSITGWCSWFAFMRGFNQRNLEELLAVWKDKHFADYGYRFIQIDDCFQGAADDGREMTPMSHGYPGGRPETWLQWRRDLFPSGMAGYVSACRSAGFEPGVWIGSQFADVQIVQQHPDWFVQGTDGKPFAGDWVGYSVDATIPAAANAVVRPTYRGIRDAGFSYVKIDILRHRLYDNLNHNPAYCARRGCTPAEIFRAYLQAARAEVGPDTFMLSCWGVLPESVGIADACRIGADGYGPVTMQQYNSWNGIVWRNDPDVCDVAPHFNPSEGARTTAVQPAPADTIIRPALASIAGGMLILGDKPAVYRDDPNLNGLRRSAPVLFSVPGQLYDYDPSKSFNLIRLPRAGITSGASPSPIDGDQFGPVCQWWLNEFNRPFESWNVLHRLNWTNGAAEKTTVHFADIGLDPRKTYLVYEFWSHQFLGAFRDNVEFPAIKPMGLESYAIREQLDRPQIVSTSRHISQGGVDLLSVDWKDNALSGKSAVVDGDRYELAIHVPDGYAVIGATLDHKSLEVVREGQIVRMSCTPKHSAEVSWSITFTRR